MKRNHGEQNVHGRKKKKNQPRKRTRKMTGGKMMDGMEGGPNRAGRSDEMSFIFSTREEKNIFVRGIDPQAENVNVDKQILILFGTGYAGHSR